MRHHRDTTAHNAGGDKVTNGCIGVSHRSTGQNGSPFLRRFPTPVKHGWQMQATPTTFEPSSEPHTGSVSSSGRNRSFALASGSTSASPHQRESAHELIRLPRTHLYPLPPSSFKSQKTRMDARSRQRRNLLVPHRCRMSSQPGSGSRSHCRRHQCLSDETY